MELKEERQKWKLEEEEEEGGEMVEVGFVKMVTRKGIEQ